MSPLPPFNWPALKNWDSVLVRRVGDRDHWVIGVGEADVRRSDSDTGGDATEIPGCRMIALDYTWPEATDRAPPWCSQLPDWTRIWAPRYVFRVDAAGGECLYGDPSDHPVRELLEPVPLALQKPGDAPPRSWQLRLQREAYLAQARSIAQHLQRGDIYEVNFCVERWCHDPGLDPLGTFAQLLQRTNAPHAAFLRQGDRYALCMSPERFLRVEQGALLTEPIKGTRPRLPDPEDDARIREELRTDPKDRSENIMAVDVARNDLGRVSAPGTVQVEELCSLRTFPNVHQLVSTVRARLAPHRTAWDAVRSAFPMASMTGAPRIRAMQLIAALEDTPRGLYSGCLGFELPDGTLDLNVVIRTITFDAATGRASLFTGGAFTAMSDPAAEWAECAVKARSILDALGDEG